MKTRLRRRWVIPACIAAGVGAGAWMFLAPNLTREPVYEGKTATVWIKEYKGKRKVLDRAHGPFEPIQPTPLDLSELAGLALAAKEIWKDRKTAFPFQEPPAAPFRYEDSESEIALRALGAEATPVLLRALSTADLQLSINAATLLGEIGPLDERVVQALLRVMRAKEPFLNRASRWAFQKLPDALGGRLPKPITPAAYPYSFHPGARAAPWQRRSHAATLALVSIARRNRLAAETGLKTGHPWRRPCRN